MNIEIHDTADAPARMWDLAEKKVQKLETFYERIEYADVYFKTGDTNLPDARIVEIKLGVPGKDLFASDRKETFEKALAGSMEKITRQLKRHKESLAP